MGVAFATESDWSSEFITIHTCTCEHKPNVHKTSFQFQDKNSIRILNRVKDSSSPFKTSCRTVSDWGHSRCPELRSFGSDVKTGNSQVESLLVLGTQRSYHVSKVITVTSKSIIEPILKNDALGISIYGKCLQLARARKAQQKKPETIQ
jgi:hypothetical protein